MKDDKDHYPSGATRNARKGKGRFDLITPHALRRLAVVLEDGAVRHGDNNWMNGLPFSRLIDSAMRHLNEYKMGDTSEDKLGRVLFNVAALIHFEETGRSELDDRPLMHTMPVIHSSTIRRSRKG